MAIGGFLVCLGIMRWGVDFVVLICYERLGLEKFCLRLIWIPLRRERITTSFCLVGAVCSLRNEGSIR